MSDEHLSGGDEPPIETMSGLMILIRIAILFLIVPMAIVLAAKYLF